MLPHGSSLICCFLSLILHSVSSSKGLRILNLSSARCSYLVSISLPVPLSLCFSFSLPLPTAPLSLSGTEWHQLHTLSSPSAPVDLIISLLKYSVLCSHLWQILTFLLETKVIHLLCEFSSAVNDRRDPLAKCSHFRGFITFKKKRVQVKMKLTDLLKGMILYTRKSFPC